MNRDHMKSFLAACIQPHGDLGIGEADAVGHQQQQAIGSRAKAVICRPGPGQQNHENDAADCPNGARSLHALATTAPCSRAHKVPNTITPSSTAIRGALTVVGCFKLPQCVPPAMLNSCSAITGPCTAQFGPTRMFRALIRLPSTETPSSSTMSSTLFTL